MKKLFALFFVFCLTLGLVACTKPAHKNPTEPTGTSLIAVTDPTTPNIDPNAIYRNVTTRSFTYSEVMDKQEKEITTGQISGYAIDLEYNAVDGETDPAKKNYEYRVKGWVKNADGDINNCLVEKYDGETQLWSVTIENFNPDGHTVLSDGVMVYGMDRILKDPYIIKFRESGELLWKRSLENEEITGIKTVVENADGSYAVFSAGWSGDKQCLCLNQISADGKDILFKTNEIGENRFGCAARVGDGYWARIGRDEFSVVRMDNQGNIVDTLSFGEENVNYDIQGIVEYNGKVYMSVNSSPKIAEKRQDSYNSQVLYDIFALSEDVDDETIKEQTTAGGKFEITDKIKNHYTAMLLVCDASTGIPQAFYSVKESFGGKFVLNGDGTLLWNVKNTLTAYRIPYSSSSPWEINCQLYHCALDAAGKPVAMKKTGKTAEWYN